MQKHLVYHTDPLLAHSLELGECVFLFIFFVCPQRSTLVVNYRPNGMTEYNAMWRTLKSQDEIAIYKMYVGDCGRPQGSKCENLENLKSYFAIGKFTLQIFAKIFQLRF